MRNAAEVLLNAIKENEVKDFMLGTNGYRYEDKMCPGPTNVVMITEAFSNLKLQDKELNVDKIFEDNLYKMLAGDASDLYMAMNYYRIQLNAKRINVECMNFNHEDFKLKLKETILKRENELKNTKEFDHKLLNGSLWDFIIKLNATIKSINNESIL